MCIRDRVGGGQLMTPPYLGVRKPVRWAQGIVTFLPTLGFDGYARDISVRKQAEQRIEHLALSLIHI